MRYNIMDKLTDEVIATLTYYAGLGAYLDDCPYYEVDYKGNDSVSRLNLAFELGMDPADFAIVPDTILS